jgi:GTP-sensing pleiotropic transcriptional regulator CodY
MQITKRRLKEIIKEEMDHLATTGDINSLTESEKLAFQIILEKLTPNQLEEFGLKKTS